MVYEAYYFLSIWLKMVYKSFYSPVTSSVGGCDVPEIVLHFNHPIMLNEEKKLCMDCAAEGKRRINGSGD